MKNTNTGSKAAERLEALCRIKGGKGTAGHGWSPVKGIGSDFDQTFASHHRHCPNTPPQPDLSGGAAKGRQMIFHKHRTL